VTESTNLGDDKGKVLVRRILLPRGRDLGLDGPESLESWRAAKLEFP
jgi:hypothetical protein